MFTAWELTGIATEDGFSCENAVNTVAATALDESPKTKVIALIEQAQETPALFEEKMEDTHDIMRRRELRLPEPKSEVLSGFLG